MDILKINARPQYKVIINAGSKIPLEVKERTQLEIGFGNGEFTVQYAKANPEIMLYGLEISRACVLKCARRAEGLKNLKILCTDARYMLRELFSDETLEKIIMNFPCPWPGNGNAHRRVTAKDFSDGLASVLKIGGIFELVTDDNDYANEVWNKLSKHEALEAFNFEINPSREVTTKYERKWLEEGKNIHRLTFRKIKKFTSQRRVETGEEEMHIKIDNSVNENDILNLDGVFGKKENNSFWKFGKFFSCEKVFLLETLTSDEEFEQRFYFKISNRDDGTLIKIDRASNAFLTPAVRAAISDLSSRLKK